MLDPLPHLTIALALAALFAASVIHKLSALAEWPGVVRNYELVPDALVGAVAFLVPCGEALTAGALLWPATRTAGALAAAALLIAYGVALGVNLRRGRTAIDCGCFGSRLRQGIAPWMLWRNGLIALLALALVLPVSGRPQSVAELAVGGVFAATLACLYPVVAVVVRPKSPAVEQHGQAAIRARAGS